jgi:hypothetical protein
MPQQRGGALTKQEGRIMNRITHYALALALGFSAVSTAAIAAESSKSQSANAQYASLRLPDARQASASNEGTDNKILSPEKAAEFQRIYAEYKVTRQSCARFYE